MCLKSFGTKISNFRARIFLTQLFSQNDRRKYFAVVLEILENRKSQNRAAGVYGALRSVASWSMLQLGPKVPATERRAPQTPAARF